MSLPLLGVDAAQREGPPHSFDLLLLDHVRIEAWDRLLFVECGDGWLVEEAWRRARRGYACGVDTSTELVTRATELRGVPGSLDFKLWDGSQLPCPSGFFQGVISTLVLERAAHPVAVCAEMRRVLEPGGDVYLVHLDPSPRRGHAVATSLVAMLGGPEWCGVEELTRCEVALDGGDRAAAVIIHARAAPLARPPSSAAL